MIQIQLSNNLEERLRQDWGDLDYAAKEALLLEAFRQRRLTHYELSAALGLDRFETDAMLKKHQIYEGSPTLADVEDDRETLDRVLGPIR